MSRSCQIFGVKPMSGNKVSHSNRKTKRRFLPNLKEITFPSEVLGVSVKIKVAVSTLRTINKYGNIDSFLVNARFAKLGDFAKKLRIKIKRKLISQNNLSNYLIVKEVKKTERPLSKRAKKIASLRQS